MSLVSWLKPIILDFLLIVQGRLESPNVLLIKSVIDGDGIWVWWVRENRLSLNIVELKDLITILSWQYWGHTNGVLLIWLVFLQSLEFICFGHSVVIHIIEETWIVLEALMPPQEWVVKVLVHEGAVPNHLCGQGGIW